MVDIVLRGKGNHDWFWRPGVDHSQYSVDELMGMYDTSVARNCNLVIGLVVNNEGLVPQPDVKRMEEFGRALRDRFSKPVGQTSGRGDVVTLAFERPRTIHEIVLQEDIAHGELVRRYVIEGHIGNDTWQQLAAGQSIGNKRIEHVKPVDVAEMRLRVLETRAEPRIKGLQAFGPSA